MSIFFYISVRGLGYCFSTLISCVINIPKQKNELSRKVYSQSDAGSNKALWVQETLAPGETENGDSAVCAFFLLRRSSTVCSGATDKLFVPFEGMSHHVTKDEEKESYLKEKKKVLLGLAGGGHSPFWER